jgi:hypothetical protein
LAHTALKRSFNDPCIGVDNEGFDGSSDEPFVAAVDEGLDGSVDGPGSAVVTRGSSSDDSWWPLLLITASYTALKRSLNELGLDAVDDGLDGSINGSGFAVDDAGFGPGDSTAFVDP